MLGINSFMEIKNLKTMTVELECRNVKARIRSRNDIRICWSCGHLAEIVDARCQCCKNKVPIKKPNSEIYWSILLNIDEILKGRKEPEFRIRTAHGRYWIKASTLKRYENLASSDKHERYYHFLRETLNSGEIAFISSLLID